MKNLHKDDNFLKPKSTTEEKMEECWLYNIEAGVDETIHRIEEYTSKSKNRLIITANNSYDKNNKLKNLKSKNGKEKCIEQL